jgi:CubicO group peptidase (beta-lactamase class C family)
MTMRRVTAGWPMAMVMLIGVLVFLTGAAGAFEPLPRVEPEILGLDPGGLDNFLDELEAVEGARSVVVVHRDRVVAEDYWWGSSTSLHHVRSVTKSITSTLIGIAIDRGFIDSIDVRMVDYLPADLRPSDGAKDDILVRHLLTHTAGFLWDENAEIVGWISSSNPLRYIINRPLVDTPGADFNYSTAATHVLSAVSRQATGVDIEVFAESYLFAPLGISSWRWERDPQGYPFAGHGVELRTEDMAKLGVLFLNYGRWGDERVVPAGWARQATATHINGNSSWGPVQRVSYGLLWWLVSADDIDIFMALGWGGQFVVCVPALDLVVATNARWQVNADQADAQERAILEVIVEALLPLIPTRQRRHRRPAGRLRPVAATGSSRLLQSLSHPGLQGCEKGPEGGLKPTLRPPFKPTQILGPM